MRGARKTVSRTEDRGNIVAVSKCRLSTHESYDEKYAGSEKGRFTHERARHGYSTILRGGV